MQSLYGTSMRKKEIKLAEDIREKVGGTLIVIKAFIFSFEAYVFQVIVHFTFYSKKIIIYTHTYMYN